MYSQNNDAADEDYLSASVMDELALEAAQINRSKALPTENDLHDMVRAMIPPDCYSYEVFSALCAYFQKTKIDNFIPCPKVQVTAIEQEDGSERRSELKDILDITRGLRFAQSQNKNLVMMGENRGVAYCKVRDEKKRALESVQSLLDRARLANQSKQSSGATASADNTSARGASSKKDQGKERPPVEYEFRDAMDGHAIGWRSRKIVEDLSRGKSVRIVINRFVSPDTAVGKMQELLLAVKCEAQGREPAVPHSTTVRANENELSVLLARSSGSTAVHHPSEKDWQRHQEKMWASVERSGREKPGTYRKSEAKRKRMSLGIRQGRVNAFGEDMEDS